MYGSPQYQVTCKLWYYQLWDFQLQMQNQEWYLRFNIICVEMVYAWKQTKTYRKWKSQKTHKPFLYLHLYFRNFYILQLETSCLILFPSLYLEKIPVLNMKLAKSKILVRVDKNVISKWIKMEFPRFLFLWFTAVGVVNPPDQKLYTVRQSFPEPSGFQYSERTIASTETNFTSEESSWSKL